MVGGWARGAIVGVALAVAPAALAQSNVETITVVGATPLPGTGIDADKLPEMVETLSAADIAREGTPSLTTALEDQLASVTVNDNIDDPHQPDILYRGFEASPVLGTPEGLAVYQGGVRINEAFGDTVNWDLVPDVAIARVDVVSANPVYGLNALGGAVVVTMKDGFSAPLHEVEALGGSFGRREASLQLAGNDGTLGGYISARFDQADGWREFSPDRVAQFYGDLAYRAGRVSLNLSITMADNALDGESPAPVQELAVDRRLIFTSPQSNRNRLWFPTLNANVTVNDALSVQSNLYFRSFRQSVNNGNTTNYVTCASAPGSLCQPGGVNPLALNTGAPIPDLSQGGTVPIGENDLETIATDSWGGAFAVTDTGALFNGSNHLSAGASFDRNATAFRSAAEIGTINASLGVNPSGLFVSTPEGMSGVATPVALDTVDRYYGVFATDTFELTQALAATASGRYNSAEIALTDLRGSALSGISHYRRFNVAFGAAYAFTPDATLYAGYSEGNRAPAPGEIECSDPLAPCLLPSSLSSDPPTLRQVVAHTWDAGFRGRFSSSEGHGTWHADVFRTNVDDDIYGVATSLSSGYFRNVGATRREGAEIGAEYETDAWAAYVDYDYVLATFETSLLLPSPLNSGANASGDTQVAPGDRLPGIPAHRLKAGADYRVTQQWSIGGVLVAESSQSFRGDAANAMKPLPGFAIVNLHSTYTLGGRIQLFLQVFNLFDAHYATFGVLGDPTGVGAPGVPAGPAGVDHRFESPAAPRSLFGGVRVML